jgi:hypothetical protein
MSLLLLCTVVGVFMTRYLIFSLIFSFPLLIFLILQQDKIIRSSLLFIFLIFAILNYPNVLDFRNSYDRESYKDLVEIINGQQKNNDCVFIDDHFLIYPYRYYAKNNLRVIDLLPEDANGKNIGANLRDYYRTKSITYFGWINLDAKNKIDKYLTSQLDTCQRIWFLRINYGQDPYNLIGDYFASTFGQPALIQPAQFGQTMLKLYNNKKYESTNSAASLQ